MKPTNTASLFSIPLLLLATSGNWAQQNPAPVPVTEPATAIAAVAATPAPITAETPAAVEASAKAPSAVEPGSTPAPANDKATTTPTVTTTPASPASLSADEIARRPPSEWNALIDQREREMERMRQSRYPTWPSPYSGQMDACSQQMEQQIQGRMEQLQRRLDAQRYRYQSPWDRASSDWWDFQRSQSRRQSLRTQEYLDRMMQRGMGPNQGYPAYRRPRRW